MIYMLSIYAEIMLQPVLLSKITYLIDLPNKEKPKNRIISINLYLDK